MKAVFDTNILIDYLNGVDTAAAEFELYDERLVSVVTQIEVLVGAQGPDEERLIRRFLAGFKVMDLDTSVAEQAVALRRQHGLKVPDAIVYASAREQGCMLVSRNTKDFKTEWPDIRAPYVI
jgi:predicted nucleic acid-binding protein